jgi:hypothetical protein
MRDQKKLLFKNIWQRNLKGKK